MFVTALLLSGVASAEPAPAPATPPAAPAPAAAPKFEDLDVNKDLSLDKTEVAKHEVLTRDFATVDTDKSGKVSKDEFAAWAAKAAKG